MLGTSGEDVRGHDELVGPATISTSGGHIELRTVKRSASLETSGGDIEARGANGTITARTSGGDIILRESAGSVEARTSGGDVLVELIPSRAGSSTLTTTGGDITLFLPGTAPARSRPTFASGERRRAVTANMTFAPTSVSSISQTARDSSSICARD